MQKNGYLSYAYEKSCENVNSTLLRNGVLLNEQYLLKRTLLLQDYEYTIYGRVLDAQDNQRCGSGVGKGT